MSDCCRAAHEPCSLRWNLIEPIDALFRRCRWLLLTLTFAVTTASPAAAQLTDPDQGDGLAEVQQRVFEAFESQERVRVFIELQ